MATCARHHSPIGANGTCVLCEGARLADEDRGKKPLGRKPRHSFLRATVPPDPTKRGRPAKDTSVPDVGDDGPDEPIDPRHLAIDPVYFS